MTRVVPNLETSELAYPSAGGEPVAETDDHLDAILTTLAVLKKYLADRRATVLANEFLYYARGLPRLHITPDVMVIFDVEPGKIDTCKIWEECPVPKVIFEITSPATKWEDENQKKDLYEKLEVQEYWLFDPKGEWITEKLQGYRLRGDNYELITDSRSEVLQLRLEKEGTLIGFYREDNGEKILINDELASALKAERQRVAELESLLARYRERFGELPQDNG